MEKAAIFWSGGKDSAYALFLAQKEYDVKYLVTTFSVSSERVTMHGLDPRLIEQQAENAGIPLKKMWVKDASNESYELALSSIFSELKKEGISNVIFGDIFLEDLRKYRDRMLGEHGMKGIYPLWKKDTSVIIEEMKHAGFHAIICCADASLLAEDKMGMSVWELEKGNYDVCGENGEFHTFCFAGPVFKHSLNFVKGKIVKRNFPLGISDKSFLYLDLIAAD